MTARSSRFIFLQLRTGEGTNFGWEQFTSSLEYETYCSKEGGVLISEMVIVSKDRKIDSLD